MTSLAYGLDMPYEVQLEHHEATSTTNMAILEPQRSPGQPATRHLLVPGVYMVSLTYNGAAEATLRQVDGGVINRVSVPAGTSGVPRTSAPMKISVQSPTEHLQVLAPSTGGSARATISVIPASTFDEMEESAKGASVLSEISDLKTTKADKAEVADITTRLDTKADKVDVQNDLSDVVGLLAGWTADAIGGRNLIPETTTAPTEKELSDSSYYWDIGTGAKLEAGVEYTFSVIVDKLSDDDTSVGIELGLGNGRNYRADLPGVRLATIPYGERVTITFTPTEDRISEGDRDHLGWRIRNSQKAVTVAYRELKLERGRRATPWTPAPEDSVADMKASGIAESLVNPLAPIDHSLALRLDITAGTCIFAGDTMIYGHTGLREIDHDNVKSGRICLSRHGSLVSIHLNSVIFHNAPGSVHLSRLPVPYRPDNDVRFSLYSIGSMSTSASGNVSTGGYFNIYGTSEDTALSGQVTFTTSNYWPSTLIGLPA